MTRDTKRTEMRNPTGEDRREHTVYDMAGDGWDAITDVRCPVEGCGQTLVWYEAGYTPGYRVCMRPLGAAHDVDTLRHRFCLDQESDGWSLILLNGRP